MRIAVIDGQGGGIGKYITERLRKELAEEVEILALGTNALAVAAMLKAGANEGASGENAVTFNVSRVDLIIGPIGIVMANAMLGEVTPRMAEAISSSPVRKILLPVTRDEIEIAGYKSEPLPHLIEDLLKRVKTLFDQG
jgi:NAD(P)-dependent dehydrogenase (short-subunit alcohol dehydrogenase family)